MEQRHRTRAQNEFCDCTTDLKLCVKLREGVLLMGRRNLKKLEKKRIEKEEKEVEKGEEKRRKEEGEDVFNHYFSRAQKPFVH